MRVLFALSFLILIASTDAGDAAEPFTLELRHQVETSADSGRYHLLGREENWDAAGTAVIVCDMWDSHHCYRAVRREQEFAPRLNQLLIEARNRGATIIHAPSDCMQAYVDHPARGRAIMAPAASNHPPEIGKWCYQIPSEEAAVYPIDQTDGGEDDTPAEHAAWEAELRRQGRNPATPWQKQIDAIEIDPERDFITDSGTEVWNILEANNIDNVMFAGVHTNMCVLGRPFGLRRLSQAGKNVVLVSDLTDTMYNPAAAPYVSHHSGTDLIISHIQRYVCPTITSDQILGGTPFRFADDRRPHVAIVISEPEYETERTLPLFAAENLVQQHRLTIVYGSETEPDALPGIEFIDNADCLLISVRRRTPPLDQLDAIRKFVMAGKPVIGIRTANHAFSLRTGEPPANRGSWPEFDAQVFGGSYTNHYGNELTAIIRRAAVEPKSPAANDLYNNLPEDPFVAGGSLYKVAPVDPTANILLVGQVPGQQPEPVAWTYRRPDGGKSFYTSLGTPADFDHPAFRQLLNDAIAWAVQGR
jgi:nicotinamidase-related amidase/type 1 glutamine amidotransferase